MPSMQDKVNLVSWVENLPSREHLPDYDAVLKECAERYGNESPHLAMVLDLYVDMFRKSMAKTMKKQMEHTPDGGVALPDPSVLEEIFSKSLQAVLLRMWTYASEYYQRYRGSQVFMPVTDEALSELFKDGD